MLNRLMFQASLRRLAWAGFRSGLAFAVVIATAGANRSPGRPGSSAQRSSVIVVVGAPGEAEFGESFKSWAESWEKAGHRANAQVTPIGLITNSPVPDRERLQLALANEPKEGVGELWLVFLGHGTFDSKEA